MFLCDLDCFVEVADVVGYAGEEFVSEVLSQSNSLTSADSPIFAMSYSIGMFSVIVQFYSD